MCVFHNIPYSNCSKMLLQNVTGTKLRENTISDFYCSRELIREVHNHFIFLAVLNTLVSATAFLGNILALIALYKESSLNPASKLLYCNLAITDLCVGLIVQPLKVICCLSAVIEQGNLCRYILKTSVIMAYILGGVSLTITPAIGVDRLLALLLQLRYKKVVTLKKTFIVVSVIWVWTIASTVKTTNYDSKPLAETVWGGAISISLCLAISIFCYTKIYLILRKYQNQVQNLVPQRRPSIAGAVVPLNIARYKRAVSSALWVQVALVVCYLPYSIVAVITIHKDLCSPVFLALTYAGLFTVINSSLNPLLYCWKNRNVRQAMMDTLSKLRFSSS